VIGIAIEACPGPHAARPWSPAGLLAMAVRGRALLALLVVIAYFAAVAPDVLSVANLLITARRVAIIAVLTIGVTFVILTGGIDLSVGSMVGLERHGGGCAGAERHTARAD